MKKKLLLLYCLCITWSVFGQVKLLKDFSTNYTYGDFGTTYIGKTETGRKFFWSSGRGVGIELFYLDSTNNGFVFVKDINPGNENAYAYDHSDYAIVMSASINNVIYFFATTKENGNELWRSDGTNAGTFLVKDLEPGPTSSFPNQFIKYKNNIYFYCQSKPYGFRLWKTDGTEKGTTLLLSPKVKPTNFFAISNIDYLRGVNLLCVFKNELLFYDYDSAFKVILYKSNGDTNNFSKVLQANNLPIRIYSPNNFYNENDSFLIVHCDVGAFKEICTWDGINLVTKRFQNLNKNFTFKFENIITIQKARNNLYYFRATKSGLNREDIYCTDLKTFTDSVTNFNKSSNDLYVVEIISALDSGVVFKLQNSNNDLGIFYNNISRKKSFKITSPSNLNYRTMNIFQSINNVNRFYFAANNPSNNYALFSYNNFINTELKYTYQNLLLNLNYAIAGFDTFFMVQFRHYYYSNSNYNINYKNQLLNKVNESYGGNFTYNVQSPSIIGEFNNKLWIRANHDTAGMELYYIERGSKTLHFFGDLNTKKSNPLLKETLAGHTNNNSYFWNRAQNKMYFAGTKGDSLGLFETNGSFKNTKLINDTAGLNFSFLFRLKNRSFCAVSKKQTGTELYEFLNGKFSLIADINPGVNTSTVSLAGKISDSMTILRAYNTRFYTCLWGFNGLNHINLTPTVNNTVKAITQNNSVINFKYYFYLGSNKIGNIIETDGTVGGTKIINYPDSIKYLVQTYHGSINNFLFFTIRSKDKKFRLLSFNPINKQLHYLWVSLDTNRNLPSIIYPGVNNSAFISVYNGKMEVYATDGVNFIPILKGSKNCGIGEGISINSNFIGQGTFNNDNELWISNGKNKTKLIKDIYSGPFNSSSPFTFFQFDSVIYFSAEDSLAGREIFSLSNCELINPKQDIIAKNPCGDNQGTIYIITNSTQSEYACELNGIIDKNIQYNENCKCFIFDNAYLKFGKNKIRIYGYNYCDSAWLDTTITMVKTAVSKITIFGNDNSFNNAIEKYTCNAFNKVKYRWVVTNGKIISRSDTTEILVQWDSISLFGMVKLQITDSMGCSPPSSVYTIELKKLKSKNFIDQNLLITTTEENITINGLTNEPKVITIFDNTGKILFQKASKKSLEKIAINRLSSGIYTLILSNSMGVKSTIRFIIP